MMTEHAIVGGHVKGQLAIRGLEMPARTTQAVARHAGGLLDSLHVAHTSVRFEPLETIFAQGDRSSSVLFIERGRVKLSVRLPGGRTSVVANLSAGAFFGEGALAGQRRRRSTAESVTSCTIAIVKTTEMRQRLLEEPALSDRLRSHLLERNVRIEQDVVDQIFNGCEKRLARVLLLLVHFHEHPSERYLLPRISRELLAEMSGNTASKVGALMNQFRRLGFLERNSDRRGGVHVHRSMLSVVLQG